MSIIAQQLQRPNIKPKWHAPLGAMESVVAYNCRKYGFPIPVLAMPFWEGAGNKVYDVSGKMNHGTLIGGTTWKGGKFGNALSFDGVNDYVNVGDKASLSFGNGTTDLPFTLSAWIQPTSVTNFVIISKYLDEAPFNGEWSTSISSGYLYIQCLDASTSIRIKSFGSQLLTNNTRYFVTFTYNGSGNQGGLNIYLNGIYDASQTKAMDNSYIAMHNMTANVEIGSALRESGLYYGYANGSIDDVRIYNRALTPAQVKFSYNNPFFMYQLPEEILGYSIFKSGIWGLSRGWGFIT